VTLDELAPTRFGLREPNADAPRVEVADIAAFVVPGLAFDRAGQLRRFERLGQSAMIQVEHDHRIFVGQFELLAFVLFAKMLLRNVRAVMPLELVAAPGTVEISNPSPVL